MSAYKRKTKLANPQIGRNVRRLRVEQGLSLRDFCDKVEPPITPVQLLSTEKLRREPTLSMVDRYAAALKVDREKLLDGPKVYEMWQANGAAKKAAKPKKAAAKKTAKPKRSGGHPRKFKAAKPKTSFTRKLKVAKPATEAVADLV